MSEIRFEIWKSTADGQWYWHVGSLGNNEILARSTDGYVNRSDCLHSLQLVRGGGARAGVFDRDTAQFLTLPT